MGRGEELKAADSLVSAVRFTDYPTGYGAGPSNKLLGYFHMVRFTDWLVGPEAMCTNLMSFDLVDTFPENWTTGVLEFFFEVCFSTRGGRHEETVHALCR
jgi:hypothetical protein